MNSGSLRVYRVAPYAVDLVAFALETRHGSWVAQVPVKPKGISKRKKSFGKPHFRFFTETAGRFAELCYRQARIAMPVPAGCIDRGLLVCARASVSYLIEPC